MTSDVEALRDRIAAHFLPEPPVCLGVAVSGGSDSTALLVLLHEWMKGGGPEVRAVTVDHGLRPESAAEAAQVARICADLNIPHDILHWGGWSGQGNLPDQARLARYDLMADWAAEQGIADVSLGHTANDQAETFLMRLAREAGVDGLAAMAPRRNIKGIAFHRPMLEITREALRDILRARSIGWIDDPTNEDKRYERVRARNALLHLSELGIGPDGLSRVAHHMSDVRATLYHYAYRAARQLVHVEAGDLVIAKEGFTDLPQEIARRLIQEALKWVSGAGYGPRGRAVDQLLHAIGQGRDMTLHGCHLVVRNDTLRIMREFRAVADLRCDIDALWDGRWRLVGPGDAGLHIAALGDKGLMACPERHETGLPALSMKVSPGVWQGENLVAAPSAGLANGWSAHLVRDEAAYLDAFLSH